MPERTARYALDEPRTTAPLTYAVGAEVRVVGWAFVEPHDEEVAPTGLEILDAQSGIETRVDVVRMRRPDVVTHFGDHTLMSGFQGRFLLDSHARGTRTVRLRFGDGPSAPPPVDLFSFAVTPLPYEVDVRVQLAARFLTGVGLEVGALQRRLPVPGHCSVTYVDRMGLPELMAHYPELAGQPIQEADLIDDAETLTKIETGTQDFVIANHFLEHCENPIQTVANFLRVLAHDGVLYMAIPDKRFTFDVNRPVTTYERLADTFRLGHRSDRAQLYAEWAAYVIHTPASEVEAVGRRLLHESYSIHFNVWALPDVLEFFARIRKEFALPVTLDWVVCSDNEVIVILRKE
jgi:SAM-dependent methyltransferase